MSRFERYRWSGGAGGLVDVGHTTGDRPTAIKMLKETRIDLSKREVTGPTVGHYMLVVGNNETKEQIYVLDPGSNRLRIDIISYEDLTIIWKQQPNIFIGSGDYITYSSNRQ
jgi:phage-related protein